MLRRSDNSYNSHNSELCPPLRHRRYRVGLFPCCHPPPSATLDAEPSHRIVAHLAGGSDTSASTLPPRGMSQPTQSGFGFAQSFIPARRLIQCIMHYAARQSSLPWPAHRHRHDCICISLLANTQSTHHTRGGPGCYFSSSGTGTLRPALGNF